MRTNILILGLVMAGGLLAQNPADYLLRQQAYIDSCLANPNRNTISVQAHEGLEVDTNTLNGIYDQFFVRSTIDFRIVHLVRTLLKGDGTHDSTALAELDPMPFWITPNDTLHGYWSENHMIQWMSSAWLLHEAFGRPIRPTLRQRLVHYLDLKIEYGFYEFFSTTYAQYSLSGLLNLADLAQDTEIRSKAQEAAKRLLTEQMLFCTASGVTFPVAGRNYWERYRQPYGSHSDMIYLISGRGRVPRDATQAGPFLATSDLDVSDVIASWRPVLDTVIDLTHPLEDAPAIHAGLTEVDRVMMQWSAGMYVHPMYAAQSVPIIDSFGLWTHVDFETFSVLGSIPPENIVTLAENLSAVSAGSVLAGARAHIFRSGDIALASLEDYWKGKVGYQQFTHVATVKDAAVFTSSGPVETDWDDRSSLTQNTHQPLVTQDGHVALVMYRPENLSAVLPFDDKTVALFWQDGDFDEVRTEDDWVVGRVDGNYLAVRRPCVDSVRGWAACPVDSGHTWVFAVGDSTMYTSFDAFADVVSNATVTETWTRMNGDTMFRADVVFDTTEITATWGRSATGVRHLRPDIADLHVTPNPASDATTLSWPSGERRPGRMTVVDGLGRIVQVMQLRSGQTEVRLDVSGWAAGLYGIVVDHDGVAVAGGRLVVR